MPDAARLSDPTGHAATPLAPGTASEDVEIGFLKAWRALPAGVGAGIESASNQTAALVKEPLLDPKTLPQELGKIHAALNHSAQAAESKGSPGASASVSSAYAALVTAETSASTAYKSASAYAPAEPAARATYTEAMNAATAAFAAAAVSAIAGMTDQHVCPMPGAVPHGPGVVTKGSQSVEINFLPASRKGDKVFEATGGSDPIAAGCPTVEIGDEGGPPAPDEAAAVAAAIAAAEKQAQAASSTRALLDAATAGVPLIEVCPSCTKLRAAAQQPKHRIAFRVVTDGTSQAVPGIALRVTLPDGQTETHTTDQDGRVDIDDLETPGVLSATCEIKGARLPTTYDFVAIGEVPSTSGESETPEKPTWGLAAPTAPEQHGRIIAEIEEHKVRTGETLESLARQAGLSWQELAMFNWGTCIPKEVNKYLREVVGCTQRTRDGSNYIFSTGDDPGIVYIPRQWRQSGLHTDQEYTLRTRRRGGFELLVLDAGDRPVTGRSVLVTQNRQEVLKQDLDESGRVWVYGHLLGEPCHVHVGGCCCHTVCGGPHDHPTDDRSSDEEEGGPCPL